MKIRLLFLTFMLTLASSYAEAGPANLLSLSVQEQIAELKRQNQEMHAQIEAMKQQIWQASSSGKSSVSSAPQVVTVTNGKDAAASVQSLKWAIEAMNGRH